MSALSAGESQAGEAPLVAHTLPAVGPASLTDPYRAGSALAFAQGLTAPGRLTLAADCMIELNAGPSEALQTARCCGPGTRQRQ